MADKMPFQLVFPGSILNQYLTNPYFIEKFTEFSKYGTEHNSDGTEINLMNSDLWLRQAAIIDENDTSLADGAIFFKFVALEKNKLNIKEYVLFLQELCLNRNLNFHYVFNKLIHSSPPSAMAPSAMEEKEPFNICNISLQDCTYELINKNTTMKLPNTVQIILSDILLSQSINKSQFVGIFLFQQVLYTFDTTHKCLLCHQNNTFVDLAHHYLEKHDLTCHTFKAELADNCIPVFLESDIFEETIVNSTCKFCYTTLKTLNEIKLHCLSCHNKIVIFVKEEDMLELTSHLICSICSNMSKNFTDHHAHMKSIHKLQTYICKFCPYITSLDTKLLNHVKNHPQITTNQSSSEPLKNTVKKKFNFPYGKKDCIEMKLSAHSTEKASQTIADESESGLAELKDTFDRHYSSTFLKDKERKMKTHQEVKSVDEESDEMENSDELSEWSNLGSDESDLKNENDESDSGNAAWADVMSKVSNTKISKGMLSKARKDSDVDSGLVKKIEPKSKELKSYKALRKEMLQKQKEMKTHQEVKSVDEESDELSEWSNLGSDESDSGNAAWADVMSKVSNTKISKGMLSKARKDSDVDSGLVKKIEPKSKELKSYKALRKEMLQKQKEEIKNEIHHCDFCPREKEIEYHSRSSSKRIKIMPDCSHQAQDPCNRLVKAELESRIDQCSLLIGQLERMLNPPKNMYDAKKSAESKDQESHYIEEKVRELLYGELKVALSRINKCLSKTGLNQTIQLDLMAKRDLLNNTLLTRYVRSKYILRVHLEDLLSILKYNMTERQILLSEL